jgi:hypothetical protein
MRGVAFMKSRALRTVPAVAAALVICCFAPHALSGATVELSVGESMPVGDKGLWIGFTGVVSDSRCPEGLLCFWEGDAAAGIWAAEPPESREDFVLHTYARFGRQAEYGDYRISLLAVEPYPSIYREIDPDDYRVTLAVEEDILGVQPTTWGAIKSLYRD